jgi:uncharacterized membrane protein YphA (DoxX/SURF4 family)
VLQNRQKIFDTLRIASAMCFIGHGAFGIITKPIWCNYFAIFGIGHDMAYKLMPVVGTMDILLGISLLFFPTRTVLAWLVVWSCATALMRPLSGEPLAEFIERVGNAGAPLALLLLTSGNGSRNSLHEIKSDKALSVQMLSRITLCLRIVAFLFLAGHGWLNVIGKKGLILQYTALGFSHPAVAAISAGIFEIATALVVLIRPMRHFLILVICWKMTSELFYPHYEIFEWIERGGSYGVLISLWFALDSLRIRSRSDGRNNNKAEFKPNAFWTRSEPS